MAKEMNPFVVSGIIPDEYFCDRVNESARLIKSVCNANNMVLISQRRMGKTGLIQHCYNKTEIKDQYYTFFIDILATTSLREFTFLLGKAVYEGLIPQSRKMLNTFIQTLKSINGKFGFDPISGLPTFNLELGDIEHPEFTLEEIFLLLSKSDKRCLIAIDEFQQLSKYPEKNIEALLRTHIQNSNNLNFIFAGSERSILSTMFLSAARPFYRSADTMELGPIDEQIYTEFVSKQFFKNRRTIQSDNIKYVYLLFNGHTFYLQKTFNEAYAETSPGEECTIEKIHIAIEEIILLNEINFRQILSQIPERQKELLIAIAKEGEAGEIMSNLFIKKHKLSTTSSIQSALKQLLKKDLITENFKTYSITDKLLSLWIKLNY